MASKSNVPSGSAEAAEASSSNESKDKNQEEYNNITDCLRSLIAKLRISDVKRPQKEKVLEDFSIDGIAELIKNEKCKKILTMAGAGISTSAGIPDFRSPGSGLYDNLQKYNLPYPEAVFELGYFEENPKPFFALAKELYPGTFKPTLSHYFLKLLDQKGLLLRHYTQNIDTLERVAGLADEKLVEAHGTFYTGHCLCCRKKYNLSWMKDKIFADEIPICEKCPGVVKPDIVFFGETLPEKFYECTENDFKECDLLIILGSSLVVQPFASLVNNVSSNCPRLLINREKVGKQNEVMEMLRIGGGLEYDSPNNTRDALWLGDCDDGCQLLADKLGWGEELKKIIAEQHKRIDDGEVIPENLVPETSQNKIIDKPEKKPDDPPPKRSGLN